MRIGIDLGGTKIEILVLNKEGKEVLRQRVATPQGDYQKTLKMISKLVIAAELKMQVKASVGIATPGAISPQSGLIKNSNSVCLIGKPLGKDLEFLLQREIRMANDADCFALSEATDGAALGASSVFGVILGTGVGGGIVVNSQLVNGPNAIAGEWGHNPLPWPTPEEMPGAKCYCGKRGCIETFLSGPALEREYRVRHNTDLSVARLFNPNSDEDKNIIDLRERFFDRLARALAHVINILDPEVIVFGGGVSNIKEIYQRVPGILSNYVFSNTVKTSLKQALHGDSSGVRGAACLWPTDAV